MATQIAITDVDTTNDTTDEPERAGGIYSDLPASDYYDLDRPGSTAVEAAANARSTAEYAHERESDDSPSTAQTLGQLVHMRVLEPDRWQREIIDRPEPPVDRDDLSSTDMAIADAIATPGDPDPVALSEQTGVQLSTIEKRLGPKRESRGIGPMARYMQEWGQPPSDEHVEIAQRCRGSIYDVDEARELLKSAKTEVSALAEVEGIDCRARMDFLADLDVVRPGDLKTTCRSDRRSAHRDDWGYVVGNEGYHVQAGLYIMVLAEALGKGYDEVIEQNSWWWVAVETDAPYLASVHRASRGTLEAGIEAARDGLETIRKYRSGDRSGYDQQGMGVSVPEYLL
jgi:hypothetical protein